MFRTLITIVVLFVLACLFNTAESANAEDINFKPTVTQVTFVQPFRLFSAERRAERLTELSTPTKASPREVTTYSTFTVSGPALQFSRVGPVARTGKYVKQCFGGYCKNVWVEDPLPTVSATPSDPIVSALLTSALPTPKPTVSVLVPSNKPTEAKTTTTVTKTETVQSPKLEATTGTYFSPKEVYTRRRLFR